MLTPQPFMRLAYDYIVKCGTKYTSPIDTETILKSARVHDTLMEKLDIESLSTMSVGELENKIHKISPTTSIFAILRNGDRIPKDYIHDGTVKFIDYFFTEYKDYYELKDTATVIKLFLDTYDATLIYVYDSFTLDEVETLYQKYNPYN